MLYATTHGIVGGGRRVWRNAAARGTAYIGKNLTITAPKTDQQSRCLFKVWSSFSRCKLVFGNKIIVTGSGEAAGANDIVINKVALDNSATTAPVTFSGLRTHTVTAGTTTDESDIITFSAAAGDTVGVRVHVSLTAGLGTYVFGTFYSAEGEQSFTYDPANFIDQIDGTGSLTAPTGATTLTPYTAMMLVGEVATGQWAIVGLGTSIDSGQNDEISAGAAGGGYVRRAAYAKQRAYFHLALNGYKYNDVLSGHTILTAIGQYCEVASFGFPTNEVQSGSSTAATMAIMNSLFSIVSGLGITRIYQNSGLPRCTTTDRGATVANQTPITGFTSGGVKDVVTSSLQALVGSTITGFVDVTSVVADTDPTKWKQRTFTSTLASGVAAAAHVITITARPTAFEALVINPGGATTDVNAFIARTVTVNGANFNADTNSISTVSPGGNIAGETVVGSPSYDATHPEPLLNVDMAVPLQAALP